MPLLNEASQKRDKHFRATQNLAATALSAVGGALKQILFCETQPLDRLVILENLSDTAKLLIEIHRVQSKARIAYILPSVSKEFRSMLDKTTPDSFLFGSELANKIKDAKEVAKIGKDFKASDAQSRSSKKGGSLNSRDPSSKTGFTRTGQFQGQKNSSKYNPRYINWSQKSNQPQNQGQSKTSFRPNNRSNQ